MSALPDWVDATDVLDVAWSGDAGGLRDVKRARAITDIGAEARIVATLEAAGVEIQRVEMPSEDIVLKPGAFETKPGGYYFFRIPGWAAPILEATIARSARQTSALRAANTDLRWRAAALSVWQLGGLEALSKWIHSPASRTGPIGTPKGKS